MKTITIYELLELIKDDKQPKEIKYNGYLLSWNNVAKDYYCEEYDYLLTYLFTNKQTTFVLEEKVEILEEKKIPEKIEDNNAIWEEQARDIDYYFKDVINEIIDYLDYLKSKVDE